jgi:hypothetical protein
MIALPTSSNFSWKDFLEGVKFFQSIPPPEKSLENTDKQTKVYALHRRCIGQGDSCGLVNVELSSQFASPHTLPSKPKKFGGGAEQGGVEYYQGR